MLRRIEADEPSNALAASPGMRPPEAVVAAAAETDCDGGNLPPEHPPWVRDAVAISRAARDLVARLRPIVLTAMTMWDHAVRCIAIGGRRIGVDSSGSYRIES
jgi:hypothetical protein